MAIFVENISALLYLRQNSHLDEHDYAKLGLMSAYYAKVLYHHIWTRPTNIDMI
jgi:hypothetical protein